MMVYETAFKLGDTVYYITVGKRITSNIVTVCERCGAHFSHACPSDTPAQYVVRSGVIETITLEEEGIAYSGSGIEERGSYFNLCDDELWITEEAAMIECRKRNAPRDEGGPAPLEPRDAYD